MSSLATDLGRGKYVYQIENASIYSRCGYLEWVQYSPKRSVLSFKSAPIYIFSVCHRYGQSVSVCIVVYEYICKLTLWLHDEQTSSNEYRIPPSGAFCVEMRNMYAIIEYCLHVRQC